MEEKLQTALEKDKGLEEEKQRLDEIILQKEKEKADIEKEVCLDKCIYILKSVLTKLHLRQKKMFNMIFWEFIFVFPLYFVIDSNFC